MTEISFIHAADLHLDSPFKGLSHVPEHIFTEIRESTFTALNNLVHSAIRLEVDFILIVGDLFENDIQSIKSQVKLREAFELLQNYGIEVYLSYGNHDYISGSKVQLEYPENVHIFLSERISSFTYKKNDQAHAKIYGFSYENRAVSMNKTSEYQIDDPSIPYHIAMLHGSVKTNTEHDVYAPFSIHDLISKEFNYWALGHIHSRQILKQSPPVVYPGNTQGRHKKETGEKGCFHVTLTKSKADLTFVPLHSLMFKNITIDLLEELKVDEIERSISESVIKHNNESGPVLLNICINVSEYNKSIFDHYADEIVEVINDRNVNQTNWIYIYHYEISPESQRAEHEMLEGDFKAELKKVYNKSSMITFTEELYKHRQGRKYLQSPTYEEELDLKEDAYSWLLQNLYKGRM